MGLAEHEVFLTLTRHAGPVPVGGVVRQRLVCWSAMCRRAREVGLVSQKSILSSVTISQFFTYNGH